MSPVIEPPLLLLDDGRPGHWRQVAALADRLSSNQTVVAVQLRQPWRAVAPRRLAFGPAAHPALFRALPPEPPAAILSCGRRSALALRWLERHWPSRPRTVQILNCSIDPVHFDFVIVPRHDGLAGRNVIRTLGSLNPVDDEWLARFDRLRLPGGEAAPRVVLLLGGPNRHCRWTRRGFQAALMALAGAVGQAGGSLTAVASPRTPAWARPAPECRVGGVGIGFIPCDAGLRGMSREPEATRRRRLDERAKRDSEYAGALAAATHLVATADSVNLLSEACATGKPVFVLGADQARGRVARFVRTLLDDGYALDLDALGTGGLGETLRCGRQTRVLRETPAVAVRLRQAGVFG